MNSTEQLQPYDPTDDPAVYRIIRCDNALAALAYIHKEHGAAAILRSIAMFMENNGVPPAPTQPIADARRLVLALASEVAKLENNKRGRVRA